MSQEISTSQNMVVGVIAAFIEGVLLQPTLYWKNARAAKLPFTINPRIIYRGTAASILNECQMMGLQFGTTGFFQQLFRDGSNKKLTRSNEIVAAAFGGLIPTCVTCPVELLMIQQQRNGGSFLSTVGRIVRDHGMLNRGLMRGMFGTIGRDTIYVVGLLGVTPLIQDYLMEKYQLSSVSAGLYASLIGGVAAAIPSHPFDVVKTCMQGDLQQSQFTSFSKTFSYLYNEGGIKRLFNGCFWRTINVTGTVYVANECRVRLPALYSRKNSGPVLYLLEYKRLL